MDNKTFSLRVAFVSAVIYLAATVFIEGNSPLYSMLAETILLLGILIAFVTVWKYYCIEWKKLSPNSILCAIYEKIVFPIVSIFIISRHFVELDTIEKLLIAASGIVLFIALVDIDNSIRNIVNKRLPQESLSAINRKVLYSIFPPRQRSDISPMDFIIHTMVILMIFKHIT